MNATLNTSYISDVSETAEIVNTLQEYFNKFLFVIFIILQLIFPFYVYVNRVNRERDKNTLVFPLIDHFYKMMKVTQAIYCFIYITLLYMLVNKRKFNEKTAENIFYIICVGVFAFCFCVVLIYIQVFQFFLTIMAIQKFLLYFYPSSQRYIILSHKNMHYFIRYAYYFFITTDLISIILVIFTTSDLQKLGRRFVFIFFASMNTSFFASALLYIPILISVQNVSHLRSVQESKPQIYIFWQTMTALVVKMIYAPYVLFVYSNNVGVMIALTRMLDAFSVPVIIQISYLTCNRQNVITLFSSFKGRKLIKELLTPEVTTRVSPDPRRHLI